MWKTSILDSFLPETDHKGRIYVSGIIWKKQKRKLLNCVVFVKWDFMHGS